MTYAAIKRQNDADICIWKRVCNSGGKRAENVAKSSRRCKRQSFRAGEENLHIENLLIVVIVIISDI